MGQLVSLRENWATFLRTDALSGAGAFFTPDDPAIPPIPIFTEKLASIEEAIDNGLMKTGLNVLIATVVASEAQNQFPGELYFGKVLAVARIYENPKANKTKLPASDCAEAVAWYSRKFKFNGAPMRFLSLGLGRDPKRPLCYDVIFNASTGSFEPPART